MKKHSSFMFLLVTALALLYQVSGSISGTLTVSNLVINAQTFYSFVIDTSTVIPSGGYITLTFPSQVTLSTTSTCIFQFGFTGTPVCAVTGNLLKITAGFPNLRGIRFMVSNVKNPGSAQLVPGFIFKFYSTLTSTTATDTSASSALFQQFLPDQLQAIVLPGDYVVGDVVPWSFQVIPKNPIPAGGIIEIMFPKWTDAKRYSIGAYSMLSSGVNTCSPVSGLTSTSLSCTFTINSLATGLDTLTITNAFSSIQTAGSAFEISVSGVTNMPTTRSYTGFGVSTFDANLYGIDSETGIVMAMLNAATLPGTQVTVTIDSPTTVDAITTYLFTIFFNNPIPINGYIEIIIPPSVGATLLTTVVAEQRINSAVTVAPISSSNPNDVILSGGYPTVADSVPTMGLVAFRLKYLQNPSVSTTSASFQIITYDSTYIIEQITTGITVQSTTGVITMNTFSSSNSRVLEYNTFTFSMTLTNALQSGCSIRVLFPTEFTIPDVPVSKCALSSTSGLSTSYSCSFVSNKLTIYSPFGTTTSAAGATISFTVANSYVQNPTSTRPTVAKFSASSLSQNGNPIDTWTGSIFTATVNSLTSATVTPQSLVAGAYPVIYTYTLQTPHAVEANAYIYIQLPSSDLSIYDSSLVQSQCSAIQTVTQSNIACSSSTGSIKVKGGFYGSLCACTGIIQFTVGGMLNPRSLTPSGTFLIAIYTSDNYVIYSQSTGITVTMATANTASSMTLKQQFGVNGQVDNYYLSVMNHNQKQFGDYMLIYAPNEVTLLNTTQCSAKANVVGFSGCSLVSSNKMKITFNFGGNIAPGSGFSFALYGVKNAGSMAPSSQFRFETYTTNGYLISNITNGPTVTNTKASSLTSASIRPSVFADGQWTNLTFTIVPQNYIEFMTMNIVIPSDMLTATATPNLCKAISTYTVSTTLVCGYTAATRTLTITSAFTVLTQSQYNGASITLRQMQFMVGQFINPVGQTYSGNFTITTFDKGGYAIESLNASVPYICSSQCQTCNKDDYTTCTSCFPASKYNLLFMGTCVQQCPAGTTQTATSCIVCPNNCQLCSSTNSTCSVCGPNYFFLDGSCVTQCPSGYQLQGPSACTLTVIPVQMFTEYFQKTQNYQCYMFPFSAASILTTLIMALAACCSKKLVEQEVNKIREKQKEEHRFLSPLRIIEVSIAIISFIELLGWGFFLYCMYSLQQQQLPFYVVCGAAGFNFFLNFVMTCGILKSKENCDDYLNEYSEKYTCTYRLIKLFTLFISHKGFYMSFTRYQRDRSRHSHFDFSYFDNGDEDGVSGFCFKFFFMSSILLLHGAVIAACVLNYMTNNLSNQLFCLDLDIIGMTTFQALLVLITLIQCGGDKQPSRIYPRFKDEYDEPESMRGLDDPDATLKGLKSRHLNGGVSQIKPKEEEEQLDDEMLSKGTSTYNDRKRPKNSKMSVFGTKAIEEENEEDHNLTHRQSTAKKPQSTNKIHQYYRDKKRDRSQNELSSDDDQNHNPFHSNMDTKQSKMGIRRRDPKVKRETTMSDRKDSNLEDSDYQMPSANHPNDHLGSRQSVKKRSKDKQVPVKKKPKGKLFERDNQGPDQVDSGFSEDEDRDDFETIDPNAKRQKAKKVKAMKKKKRGTDAEDSQEESDMAKDVSPSKQRKQKPGKKQKKQVKKISESEDEQESTPKPLKKEQKKRKRQRSESDISDEEEESDSDESDQSSVHGKKMKVKKQTKKQKRQRTKKQQKKELEQESPEIKEKKKIAPIYEQVSHSASSLGENDIFAHHDGPIFEKHLDPNTGIRKRPEDHNEIHDHKEPSYRDLVDQINTVTQKDQLKNESQADPNVGSIYGTIPSHHDEIPQNEDYQPGDKKGRKHVSNDIQPKFGNKISDSRSSLPIEANVAERHLLKPKKIEKAEQQVKVEEQKEIEEKVQELQKVAPQFENIKQSLPTQQDGEHIQGTNLAHFENIGQSISTQLEEKIENVESQQHQPTHHQESNHSLHKSMVDHESEQHVILDQKDVEDAQMMPQSQVPKHDVNIDDDDNITQMMKKLPHHQSQYNPSDPSLLQSSNMSPEQHHIQKTPTLLNQDSREQIFEPDQQPEEDVHIQQQEHVSQHHHSPVHSQEQSQKHSIEQKIETHPEIKPDSQQISNHSKEKVSSNRYRDEDQMSRKTVKSHHELPGEAESQFIKKQRTQSLDHLVQNQDIKSQKNSTTQPPKNTQRQQQLSSREHSHHETDEIDEENKDVVNKDDIKPKTMIIFSDKSESSVEEMMEDTPSNYNVLNGRLEEDSKGLRSLMYKAISKKYFKQSLADKASVKGSTDNEDQESRRIISKASERRTSSQGRPPTGIDDNIQQQQRREEAKLFIQKAEASGVGLFGTGATILKNQTDNQRNQSQNNSQNVI